MQKKAKWRVRIVRNWTVVAAAMILAFLANAGVFLGRNVFEYNTASHDDTQYFVEAAVGTDDDVRVWFPDPSPTPAPEDVPETPGDPTNGTVVLGDPGSAEIDAEELRALLAKIASRSDAESEDSQRDIVDIIQAITALITALAGLVGVVKGIRPEMMANREEDEQSQLANE